MDSDHAGRYRLSVAASPPRWEVGIYAAGALALLGIAAINLWKLWRSGSYPAPSPFPNYDYRYLEQKYGAACSDVKHKRGAAAGSQRGLEKTSPVRQASLRTADTFESINELGSLELMSKDLGLAPYGPLKKSISADSLSSISSIGNNFGQDVTVGQVEVSMEYDGKAATLHVTLLQGKDLLEKEDTRFESCFMRISLLPAEQIVGISRIQRSAYAVAFDERFSIPLDPAALEENSLRFSVFGIDEDERNVSTGVAELKLSDLDLALRPFNAWLYLQDMNKVSGVAARLCVPGFGLLVFFFVFFCFFFFFCPSPGGLVCPAGGGHGGGDPAVSELPAHGRAPDGGGGQSQKPRVDQRQSDRRSLRQSLPAAGREEDQQEEDSGEEGRQQPRVQRGHDLLGAGHCAPGPVPAGDGGGERRGRPCRQHGPRPHRPGGQRHGHHPLEPDAGHAEEARVHVAPAAEELRVLAGGAPRAPGPCTPTPALNRGRRPSAVSRGLGLAKKAELPARLGPSIPLPKASTGRRMEKTPVRVSSHPHALEAAKGPAEEGPKPAKSSPNCCPAACQAPEHPACPPPGSSNQW
uniref:Synaptotagmin 12 n=1 Tax=Anser brachyrhynchus TaxID=132585 RepID=A0A8B9BXA7_9AVES